MENHDVLVHPAEISAIREDISEIKSTIQSLSQALLMLVKVEQQQNHQNERLEMHTDALHRHDARLTAIEGDVPGLKELRKWVIRGVGALMVAAIGAVLSGNLHIVIGPRPVTQLHAPAKVTEGN